MELLLLLKATYAPFTPSSLEQRLHPPYYRGCWHEVSRCLFYDYCHYPHHIRALR